MSNQRKGDDGATAVLVGILAAVLFFFSGFAVDLAQAYANRTQIQHATDAGALAAVQHFQDDTRSCAQIDADPTAEVEAQAIAEGVAAETRSGLGPALDFDIDCVDAGPYKGAIQATFAAGRTTPTYFTSGDPIQAEADSSAVMFVPGAAESFRPYGLCAANVPSATAMPSSVLEIAQPGQASSASGCPSAENGGNWWFMNCPEAPNGGMNPTELAYVLENGCEQPAEVVNPQDYSNPSSLSSSLTLNCSDKSDKSRSCLDAETGASDLKNKTPVAAWSNLLGETIIVPVFCAVPDCNPSTVDGSGTGNVYPVHTFTAVTVCGYHFFAVKDGSATHTTGDCAGNTFSPTYVEKLGCKNDNDPCLPTYDEFGNPTGSFEKPKDSVRLFLRFDRLVGGLATPSGCEINTACDGGLRQYALNE